MEESTEGSKWRLPRRFTTSNGHEARSSTGRETDTPLATQEDTEDDKPEEVEQGRS